MIYLLITKGDIEMDNQQGRYLVKEIPGMECYKASTTGEIFGKKR